VGVPKIQQLSEEINIEQQEDFAAGGSENLVCLLWKCICLKQVWNEVQRLSPLFLFYTSYRFILSVILASYRW